MPTILTKIIRNIVTLLHFYQSTNCCSFFCFWHRVRVYRIIFFCFISLCFVFIWHLYDKYEIVFFLWLNCVILNRIRNNLAECSVCGALTCLIQWKALINWKKNDGLSTGILKCTDFLSYVESFKYFNGFFCSKHSINTPEAISFAGFRWYRFDVLYVA